ncbi:MAG: hypothetical protein LUG12_13005 [Erysipelotrichaceae bacterium]|nr:hypothetical protein [Erysipelotrichaceae bacterium]
MKRSIKNILLVLVIVLSLFMIGITVYHAKNNLTSTSTISDSMDISGEMPSGEMPGDSDSSDGMPSGEMPSDTDGEIDIDEDMDIDSSELPDGDLPSDSTDSSSEEMADGGFAGAGDDTTMETTSTSSSLTLIYMAYIALWCIPLVYASGYLIMSMGFKKPVFHKTRLIIIYIVGCLIVTSGLALGIIYGTNQFILGGSSSTTSTSSTVEYSSTDDLHIDNTNWSYDETNDIYYQIGIVYCSDPDTVEYESMGIYVPGAYMDATDNGDGTYTCTINTTATVSGYTALTAPIVMPVNTAGYSAQAAPTSYASSGISDYTDAGFIYVYAGCRGRNNGDDYSGGAPWGVTDLKAAVRYLRYNSDDLPGNTDSIFAFGRSGGGAQSTILGSSGDSELYTPYLESIGALMYDDDGNEISDAIAGVMAWCPITSLDTANEAYEWNMGQYSTSGTRSDDSWTSALSDDMAEAYASYINALGLIDSDGNTLSLSESSDGVYTSGTYYDYLLSVIEESLSNYLVDNYTSTSDMQSYVDELNSDETWVTFDSSTSSISITSIEAFVNHCKSASKDVGAFDDLNLSQAENYVFGNDDSDALHWDSIMASLLTDNESEYSTYSDYDSSYAEDYTADLDETDSLGNDTYYRQNMYNPMYYISDYYDGYETSTVATYWRIRTGITQGDTALTVETNLALALEQYDSVESVDFATVWNQGHTTAERTGDSTTNFIEWVNECLS